MGYGPKPQLLPLVPRQASHNRRQATPPLRQSLRQLPPHRQSHLRRPAPAPADSPTSASAAPADIPTSAAPATPAPEELHLSTSRSQPDTTLKGTYQPASEILLKPGNYIHEHLFRLG